MTSPVVMLLPDDFITQIIVSIGILGITQEDKKLGLINISELSSQISENKFVGVSKNNKILGFSLPTEKGLVDD